MDSPRLLLIDDDDAAHIYHKAMLEMAGYNLDNVKTHTNVDDAIADLKSYLDNDSTTLPPDYIFVDLNMPVKSGYDFINEYIDLELDIKPDIYIVSTTKAKSDQERIEKISIINGFETKFLCDSFFKKLLSEEEG